ncbi:MAG: hypothetical protein SFW62_04785 [Alphaproteobacteria bacterium]|nr:hypothetical protein [Alphaproteobacteria bacterium]
MAKKTQPESTALVFDIRDMITETIERIREEHRAARTEDKQPVTVARALSQLGATHHVTNRAQSRALTILNDHEMTSVYALCAWVANEQDTAQETVQAITEAHFGVNHVTKLQRKDYDEVIKFLVDLRIDEMKN